MRGNPQTRGPKDEQLQVLEHKYREPMGVRPAAYMDQGTAVNPLGHLVWAKGYVKEL